MGSSTRQALRNAVIRTFQPLQSFKWMVAASFLFIVFICGAFLLHQSDGIKNVTLTIDGQTVVLETMQETLSDLLTEQEMELDDHIILSVDLEAPLEDGQTIYAVSTTSIQLTAEGVTEQIYSQAYLVSEVLQEQGLQLKGEDRVTPDPGERVFQDMEIHVIRVSRNIEEVHDEIPYQVTMEADHHLLEGKEYLVQEGRYGLQSRRVEHRYENGVYVASTLLEKSVIIEEVDEIVAFGTRQPVQVLTSSAPIVDFIEVDGQEFGFKKKLKDVTLTAYSAGYIHTGKRPGDPGYGITRSGATVQDGHTVAVDPRVIPRGWWIYIEGMGFRKAEDTGRLIKGNIIDIYFKDDSKTRPFGRQFGHTVYVIGPERPR